MRLLSVLLACIICAGILTAQKQVVRSIKFLNVEPVSVSEILQTFKEKEVKLAVERVYDPQEVDAAKAIIEKLLADKGKPGARVNVTTRTIPPRSLEVVFTGVK